MEEGILNVILVKGAIKVHTKRYNNSNSVHFCHRSESFLIVYSVSLSITSGYKPSLIPF